MMRVSKVEGPDIRRGARPPTTTAVRILATAIPLYLSSSQGRNKTLHSGKARGHLCPLFILTFLYIYESFRR